jgi:uncharacterized protein
MIEPSHAYRRPLLRALWVLGLVASSLLSAPVAQATNKKVSLGIKSFQVQAEIADRPASRARGLMFRESLADNHGMLFVFDTPSRQCMWMKNTPLPLSVAFIKADGRIANIAQMQPQTETIHCASEDVLYALEMTQGWFWSRAIKPGDAVQGLPPKR